MARAENGLTPRVLLVEDDAAFARALARSLAAEGVFVRRAGTLAEARRTLGGDLPDAVVLDLGLPDGDGGALLEEIRRRDAAVPVVVLTGRDDAASAVAAMKSGATDYLTKPLPADALRAVVRRAVESARLRREVASLREALVEPTGIVGASEAIARIRAAVGTLARAPTTVLIVGETGTGKERVARAIHAASRRKGAFVAVNCAAIPEPLFEAELFGHTKGAFTGAAAARPGLVEAARGGTLFLDEVGDLPASLQPKVLRLLQESSYRPVGADRERKADLRVVAATHRDLARHTAAGRFREDLYWRLAVVVLEIPPLRDRKEDIPPLAFHFLARHAARLGKPVTGIAPDALDLLLGHPWPGNARELENAIEAAVLFAEGPLLTRADVAAVLSRPPFGTIRAALHGDPSIVREVAPPAARLDREGLAALLSRHRGNVRAAAAEAGRNRTAFYRLLRKHGLDPADFRA